MALKRSPRGRRWCLPERAELRERFSDEEPGTVGAIVGHTGEGVSDMNLAAAMAHDGMASEVVLVARGASGSLRSRARRAGITQVVDATVVPAARAVVPNERRGRKTAREGSRHALSWSGRLAIPSPEEPGEVVEEASQVPAEPAPQSALLRRRS